MEVHGAGSLSVCLGIGSNFKREGTPDLRVSRSSLGNKYPDGGKGWAEIFKTEGRAGL